MIKINDLYGEDLYLIDAIYGARWRKSTNESFAAACFDVELNDNIILKGSGEGTIYLDLGGTKTSIDRNHFSSIEIV